MSSRVQTDRESDNYAERIAAELLNFEHALGNGGVKGSIPSMFTWWAATYLSPRLLEVFGKRDIEEIFATEIQRVAASLGKARLRVLSMGSGDCSFEAEIHRLIDQRIKVQWHCTDLNEHVLDYARQQLTKAGISSDFTLHSVDLNRESVPGEYDVVIFNHSLHHFVELEFIFKNAKASLNPGGRILVSDMIGRNGHMRWPEALGFVEDIWALLPDPYRFNNHAKCIEGRSFNNYNCSAGGDFEGVRAQDILPLMLEDFHFERFVAFGNIMDVFLDRAYGPNFKSDSQADIAFVTYLEMLNNRLIDAGLIKPTMMVGTAMAVPVDCIFDRWSPEFSVRDPSNP